MIVTTGDFVDGHEISDYLGVVRGLVVRRALYDDAEWERECEAARQEAFQRMAQHALRMNPDAVIAMRYDSVTIFDAFAEVLAYGTAVKLRRRSR